MQFPYQRGSPDPQAGGDSRDSSPYFQYQQQPPPPGSSHHQAAWVQPSQYGQPTYQHQAPPPGPSFQQSPVYGQPTPYGQPHYSQQQGYGNGPQIHQYGSYQNQYYTPPPNQPPYQQSPSYLPGPPPPEQYGAAVDHHQQQPPPTTAPPAAEDDRGVLGALAGGATGAWAGHKAHHGFLGALGGAFAGHKLQDALEDRKQEEKNKKKQRRNSHCSSASSCSSDSDSDHRLSKARPTHQPPRYAGNFSGSASQITLDRDYDLIALCGKIDGSSKLSSISLNRCLTNSDGHFKWSSEGNFGASARNVRLVEGGKVLEAELADCGGRWLWSRVILDEKISNNDGELVMV